MTPHTLHPFRSTSNLKSPTIYLPSQTRPFPLPPSPHPQSFPQAKEMASAHGTLTHLLPPTTYKRMVASWLEEDCPSLDVGGFVVGEGPGEAKLLGKSPGVLAGVPFFQEVFGQLGCWYVGGGFLSPGWVAATAGLGRLLILPPGVFGKEGWEDGEG